MGNTKQTAKVTTGITVNIESNTITEQKKPRNSKAIAITVIFLILSSFFGGTFLGKKMVKLVPQDPIYINGDTVKVEVPCPTPVYVNKPCDTLNIIMDCFKNGKYAEFFPEKVRDSLIYIPTSEDTLAIIRDWATERAYEEKIMDSDTTGSATIRAITQYNRLTSLEADINPVIKEVPYIVGPDLISPFVGVGISTNSSFNVQGGLFIKDDWGGSLMYQYDWQTKQNIWGINVMYKF